MALAFLTPSAAQAGPAPYISIGLAVAKTSVLLGSTSGFTIQDPSSGRVLRTLGKGQTVRLQNRKKGITYGGRRTRTNLLIQARTGGNLLLEKKPFRGVFEIKRERNGRITVINVLDVESYLYGVVRSEMPPRSPLDALRAQAILSRTFALKNRDKHKKQGFGLTANVLSQVYKGIRAETPEAIEAVNSTRGVVLSHEGQLASVFYSASCGGLSENNKPVWGGTGISYLQPVHCGYCRDYSTYSWTTSVSFDEIRKKLAAAGVRVGKIAKIGLTHTDTGRVENVTIHWGSRSVKVPGNKFRLALGAQKVRSLKFTVLHRIASASGKGTDSGELPEEAIQQIIYQYMQDSTTVTRASSGGVLRVAGTGFGHGVGLCQWGAKGQAEQGHDFVEILDFYFHGTRLARAYE